MKKNLLCAAMLLASCSAFAAEQHPHWGYSGDNGPNNWAKLTPEFGACAGKNQTPVNLSGFVKADLKPLKFSYKTGGSQILNNGHTVQVVYDAGSNVVIDGVEYMLKQFHFHAPSENQIKGESFPLEGHFVHADKDGNLAVVTVMFKEGHENAALKDLWAHMPAKEGDKIALSPAFDAAKLFPKNHEYYRFSGSLTTPPCTEGVRWIVLKKPVFVSKAQIDALRKVMGHDNNRPLQPINAREILE